MKVIGMGGLIVFVVAVIMADCCDREGEGVRLLWL